ncbi:replication initiation protein (plasmid) [Alkalihalophilus sp. As8PL]|uniref:Replication initiation protein n=1 Tax=Alkalihalophilus sp. As8PL TaxID=3237103 RepID=A0AB39BN76_9BACI
MKAEQLILSDSKISPEYLVTQSNSLIEAPQDLTLQEKRIILTLASLVQPGDDNFRIHRIKVKDLADIIGIKEKNFYTKVESVIEKLQNKMLTIETERSKLNMHWLSSSEYFKGQGYVELEFSEKLRPFLLELKQNYTPFKLRNVLRLRSEYYIRIYELLKQYEKVKKRVFSLEELRYHLNIPPDKYKQYAHLKNRILLKAQEELREKTDLIFEFKEQKDGRKVVGVAFYIKKNRTLLKEVLSNEAPDSTPYELLIRFGIRPDKAKSMIEQFHEVQIKRNISYILENKEHEDIDNISGYIISAIEGDYASVEDNPSVQETKTKPFSIAILNSWLSKKYRGTTSVVTKLLLEDHVLKFLNQEGLDEQEAQEFWNKNSEEINLKVKEIVQNNRNIKSKRKNK